MADCCLRRRCTIRRFRARWSVYRLRRYSAEIIDAAHHHQKAMPADAGCRGAEMASLWPRNIFPGATANHRFTVIAVVRMTSQ